VAETEKLVFEEWVVLVIGNKPCGYGTTRITQVETPGGPQFHTTHQENFTVKRLSASMTLIRTSTITEDAEGGVLSFTMDSSGAGSDIRSSGIREGDALVVSSRGQTKRYHLPRLSALGPEKIRKLTLAIPLKPGQPFSFDTFDPEYPQAVVTEAGQVIGQETHNVRGTERRLWKMTSETSTMPGFGSTIWVDDRGNDVEAVVALPGLGNLHQYVTDKAECLKQVEGAEVFNATLIHPPHALLEPDQQAEAVYRLSTVDLSKTLSLWNEGEQKVISSAPGTVQISVSDQPISPASITWRLPHADTPALHPYLESTTYLEVRSPEIQALALEAVDNEKNPVKAAHLIEKFVRRYIKKKNLRIGFASAQETARSREGDCTEHAVLCAALGRAVGLPTRCVVGLGYIPPGAAGPAVVDGKISDTGVFGFHMWAEAWVGPNQWVPMDAALDGFDVGHIAINKSALTEINPLVDFTAPAVQLMQGLSISVMGTQRKSAAKTQTAPALPTPPRRTAPALPEVD